MSAFTSTLTVDAISPTAVRIPANAFEIHTVIIGQPDTATAVAFSFRAPGSSSTAISYPAGTLLKFSRCAFQPGDLIGYLLLGSSTATFSLLGN